MAITIVLNESSASSRCVPVWCVQSNGTSAATNESGATFFFSLGAVDYGSGGSLSAVSAAAGLYSANFSASKVSKMGQGFVYYSSSTALPTMTPIMVVPVNSWDSMAFGLAALPSAAPNVTSGMPIIGNDYGSTLTVGVSNIKAATYSGVSVGADNFAPGVYSGVSFSIRDSGIAVTSYQLGNYSGVSFEVKSGGIQTGSVGKGNYSGVSLEILTGGIQTTSIGKGNYSGVSHEILTGGIQPSSVAAGTYSGMTIQGILDPTPIWNASRSSYSLVGGFGAASQVVSVNSASGGNTSQITLNSAETTTDSFYNGCLIMVQYPSGFRAGAIISAYSGSQRTASFLAPLGTAIPSGATYIIYPGQDSSLGLSVWSSYLTRSINSIVPATYSGVTVSINNIAPNAYSGVTVDGAKFLSPAGERSAASSLLSSNMGGTTARLFQQGWELLRNKVVISGSTMTVFKGDDATSSWTATISTGTATVYGVTPGIA